MLNIDKQDLLDLAEKCRKCKTPEECAEKITKFADKYLPMPDLGEIEYGMGGYWLDGKFHTYKSKMW